MDHQTPSVQNSIVIATIFVLIIWWLKLCEMMFDLNFQQLGVYPLTASGTIGIVTGPLIHGSWQHVISNTLPILLLGSFLIYGYPKSRWWTLAIIWIVSGLGVWLFGRESYHLGASGLAHGMFFYLFISGIFRRDKRSSALMMIAFYMYGGMLLSIFPREQWISFEYHLFGAISGVCCALAFRHWDPKPKRKVYSWEQQSDEDGDGDGDGEFNHEQVDQQNSRLTK
ncbi:rhomboid family intramembrane serine protease [Thalassotalea fonticola]|uniref:Rhomboid family intramembrane serine protease n=1 Tax=Thalassotalea fonticola TaxID=3065649 RepID=A0ABZ0GPE0_9GAMM|nr:rhomboid family intramembrane serine protease [Colwelliaceae bacterium S1-1]